MTNIQMGKFKENRGSCQWRHLHEFCRLFIFMSSGPEGRRTASEAHERWAGDNSSETEKIKAARVTWTLFLSNKGFRFFQTSKNLKMYNLLNLVLNFRLGYVNTIPRAVFDCWPCIFVLFNRINKQKVGLIINCILWHFSSRGAREKSASAYKVYL